MNLFFSDMYYKTFYNFFFQPPFFFSQLPGCDESYYGCCPDLVSFAQGPNFQGCPEPPIIGGCAGTRYGCCPESDEPALGENYEGCVNVEVVTCATSLYGCCPDNKTFAKGEGWL